jgi:hypothetical protein
MLFCENPGLACPEMENAIARLNDAPLGHSHLQRWQKPNFPGGGRLQQQNLGRRRFKKHLATN